MDTASIPHFKLHKQHMALSFHRVREAIVSKMLYFGFLPGPKNPADILSKHWSHNQIWHMLKKLLFRTKHKPSSQTEGSDKSGTK